MFAPRQSAFFVGWVFLLGGCQPRTADDLSTTAVQAIRTADIAWEKDFAARDTTATVAFVESTGSMLAPNAPIATGPAAIRTLFEGFYAFPGMTLHWEATEVGAAKSGDLGYSRGTYELSFTGPKAVRVTDHGKYATVWRKQADGTWKVVLDMFNSDLPVPGT